MAVVHCNAVVQIDHSKAIQTLLRVIPKSSIIAQKSVKIVTIVKITVDLIHFPMDMNYLTILVIYTSNTFGNLIFMYIIYVFLFIKLTFAIKSSKAQKNSYLKS